MSAIGFGRLILKLQGEPVTPDKFGGRMDLCKKHATDWSLIEN
jgi:hypothetical protein